MTEKEASVAEEIVLQHGVVYCDSVHCLDTAHEHCSRDFLKKKIEKIK